MASNDKYLLNALTKAGYVVIVKTCYKEIQKSKLEYVSPNASIVGINSELLMKGLKLTEDYIHPDDREKVIKAAGKAIKNNVSDYVHEYRMVGDDGNVYHITNEVAVSDIDEETFRTEFYIKKVEENESKHVSNNSYMNDFDDMPDNGSIGAEISERVAAIMETFANLSGLYSVFVDMNGKPIFRPIGPATNMGDFYDLLEKPAYKKYYAFMRDEMLKMDRPVVFDREEGGIGKILAAPIMTGNDLKGIWILGSYTMEETEMLKNVCDDQWNIANLISEYLNQKLLLSSGAAQEKGKQVRLEDEIEKRNIATYFMNLLDEVSEKNFGEILDNVFDKIGDYLGANQVLLYKADNKLVNEFMLDRGWSDGGAPINNCISTFSLQYSFSKNRGVMDNGGQYVICGNDISESERLWMLENNYKALIAQPVFFNDVLYGIFIVAQTKGERIWSEEEKVFIHTIASMIGQMIKNIHGNDNAISVNKQLIETYNNFKVGVFVRDAISGKVLFSNSFMNNLLGYDFTGGDSRSILTDLHDRFNGVSGIRNQFVTQNKVNNWRSYISGLDEIMDITEISMEWINGKAASMIILRKADDTK